MKMPQLARCKHYCKHSLQNIDKFLFVTLANEENVETIQRVSSVMIISPNNLTAVTREIDKSLTTKHGVTYLDLNCTLAYLSRRPRPSNTPATTHPMASQQSTRLLFLHPLTRA